ncbi:MULTISPECIES: urease accessory protein UreD [unclassified Hyphomicrobium]|uniref:urease accessory protein UreD n=1 Tax=unclassified Hyphomicrobium TaxID=2619925 RepID=UPI000213E6D0|nr:MULTISPECIES: urease accessory protein UreD [unclassified Hyphomicrobium]CCB67144.1 Urease accessory protein ureD [Hyphomicrobium sp. MC1]
MNIGWPTLRRGATDGLPLSGRFDLEFIRHGSRTSICRQFVSYPFHLARPFALDPLIPQLMTVYQQSSSGGLYRAEELESRILVRRDAAAHITTQAATIIHDCQGQPAKQRVDVVVEENGFLALTPDPFILFPGASCTTIVNVAMAPQAVVLLADAFSQHDPKGNSHPFDTYVSNVSIWDEKGKLLARDAQKITGANLATTHSPMRGWSFVSSFMLLGRPEKLPSQDALRRWFVGTENAVVGVSELPNNVGWGIRCLARDAVAARKIADQLFSISIRSVFGSDPAQRRK